MNSTGHAPAQLIEQWVVSIYLWRLPLYSRRDDTADPPARLEPGGRAARTIVHLFDRFDMATQRLMGNLG